MWYDKNHMAAMLLAGVIVLISGPVALEAGHELIGAIMMCLGVSAIVIGLLGLRLHANIDDIRSSKKK